MTYWTLKGRELANCNCDYGCNCQFGGLPDKGNCQAVFGLAIDEGKHGDTDISGLNIGAVFKWPGPIHEGHGECVAYVDERADENQRQALLTIMSGEDSEPGRTMFNVFASTMSEFFEPAFRQIDMDVDVDARRGHIHVDGFIDITGEPIRNVVTGREHRARIDLPDGFEYTLAEVGSASSKTRGPIAFDLENSYGQFARLHLNGQGPIRV